MAERTHWELTPYGKWLKITMIKKNIQAQELAIALGIPKQRISDFIYGRRTYGKYKSQIESLLGEKPPAEIAS